ncbi:5-bromo-4-chloroindolyl phosphate hydrolysis family protein [Thiolinea disciformis]|uniref:5-bromo-4-chloroindolyl phosphate hydrolysis family protein n=1 Tax=Thiolinea disciformis TaxID=125614 RepID=UPI00037F6B69|nr:5-bromo-4-chloroindolyl phosphate hydrolysis family protein [Thiolinea disciformis]
MANVRRYDPPAQGSGSTNSKLGLRGFLLYLLPLPLLPGALIALAEGHVTKALVAGGAFAVYMLIASMTRKGLLVEREYLKRKLARAPRTPYKTVAALFTGITTGLLAWWGADYTLIASALLGASAVLGYALSYGLDPRRDKAGNITLGIDLQDVLEALDAANVRINALDQAKQAIREPQYSAQLGRITAKAREILGTIEDDPTRLSNARKFLKVYLDGAQKVTEGYVKGQNSQQVMPEALKTDFGNVLNSIEQTFDEQHTKLLENDHFDLDVQITVLQQQLKREGV